MFESSLPYPLPRRHDGEDAREAARSSVTAPLTYLDGRGQRPVVVMDPDGGEPRRTANYGDFPVRIRDARPLAGALSLDREGFELRRHESAVTDFADDDQVTGTYYPEMERLIAEATGASRVVVFDHTRRFDDGGTGQRRPVRRVHNDYTVRSAPQRVRDLLGPEAEALLRGRVAQVNVWRPTRGPVEMSPLALVDARSVAREDLVATDLVYPERTGEIYEVAHSLAHRWYRVPEMTTDEVLLIKGYDSLDDGRARFTPHTAFDDPMTPEGAAPRESIEVRAFAFFDPDPSAPEPSARA